MISIGLIKRLIRAVSSIRCKNMKEKRIRVKELKIFEGVASIRIFEYQSRSIKTIKLRKFLFKFQIGNYLWLQYIFVHRCYNDKYRE